VDDRIYAEPLYLHETAKVACMGPPSLSGSVRSAAAASVRSALPGLDGWRYHEARDEDDEEGAFSSDGCESSVRSAVSRASENVLAMRRRPHGKRRSLPTVQFLTSQTTVSAGAFFGRRKRRTVIDAGAFEMLPNG